MKSLVPILMLLALSACADGIVITPQQPFEQSEVVLPTPEPSPRPSPSTLFEHTQLRIEQGAQLAQQNKGLIWPLFILMALLWGFIKLLQWIFNLTTSSPPSF